MVVAVAVSQTSRHDGQLGRKLKAEKPLESENLLKAGNSRPELVQLLNKNFAGLCCFELTASTG
jgi:hypothetical protein